jgi:pyruvate dehydrogenase E1 component alpha subunit
MDVLAVREACRYVREWTTTGKGPIVVEMMTYRYGGHSMSDPGTTYRTREEIQQMRSKSDAINKLRSKIVESGFATESELKAIDKLVRAEIDQAVVESIEAQEPKLDQLFRDVYIEGSEPGYIRGTTAFNGQVFGN